MRGRRLLILLAGALAALVLFLVLRPGGDEGDAIDAVTTTGPPTTTPARTASPTTAPSGPAATASPPRPAVLLVPIRIRGGRPVGGSARPSVQRGRRVRLVVRSDVADEVHLHGYDLSRQVKPGAPAQLTFRATIPGRFEIELEQRELRIGELEVRP